MAEILEIQQEVELYGMDWYDFDGDINDLLSSHPPTYLRQSKLRKSLLKSYQLLLNSQNKAKVDRFNEF